MGCPPATIEGLRSDGRGGGRVASILDGKFSFHARRIVGDDSSERSHPSGLRLTRSPEAPFGLDAIQLWYARRLDTLETARLVHRALNSLPGCCPVVALLSKADSCASEGARPPHPKN